MERRDIIQTKDLEYFQELDQELKLVPLTYDFTFKKVFKNNPTYLSNPTNIYPTTTAYSFIANKIIEKHLSNN